MRENKPKQKFKKTILLLFKKGVLAKTTLAKEIDIIYIIK
jgi:hypothetical protein